MDSFGEIIPFAKEMLQQRSGRSLLKIYVLGSTLAVLGAAGGLVGTILLPFAAGDAADADADLAELLTATREKEKEKEKQRAAMSLPACDQTEVEDVLEMETKAKHMVAAGRRKSSIRLHAS
ncbi:G0/G1 switch protein 2 [Embiotoca jacksoni]|uniref:G0/G1 switch protein 2 n=1 Tax=Embiotoca jacksoni TaxID=100190 RepID=UPI0037047E6B